MDEAVVKEEPEEGGAHPALGHDGRDHGGAHDELQHRAGECIERRRELPARRRGQKGQGKQAMPGPEAAGSHGQISLF